MIAGPENGVPADGFVRSIKETMMRRFGTLFGAGWSALLLSFPAFAQDQDVHASRISMPSRAWAAVRAIGADNGFNDTLPDVAEQVEKSLINAAGPLRQIPVVVQDVALRARCPPARSQHGRLKGLGPCLHRGRTQSDRDLLFEPGRPEAEGLPSRSERHGQRIADLGHCPCQ